MKTDSRYYSSNGTTFALAGGRATRIRNVGENKLPFWCSFWIRVCSIQEVYTWLRSIGDGGRPVNDWWSGLSDNVIYKRTTEVVSNVSPTDAVVVETLHHNELLNVTTTRHYHNIIVKILTRICRSVSKPRYHELYTAFQDLGVKLFWQTTKTIEIYFYSYTITTTVYVAP